MPGAMRRILSSRGLSTVLTITGFTMSGTGLALSLTRDDSSPAVVAPSSTVALDPSTTAASTAMTTATTTTTTTSIEPEPTTQSCTNELDGYTVQFPGDWETASATPEQECRFFAAEPFIVTADDVAVGDVFIETSFPVTYDEFIEGFSAAPGDAATTLEHSPVTIDGRRAEEFEWTTEQGDERVFGYGFVVDHDGDPLAVVSADQYDPSTGIRDVVRDMAYSLELS